MTLVTQSPSDSLLFSQESVDFVRAMLCSLPKLDVSCVGGMDQDDSDDCHYGALTMDDLTTLKIVGIGVGLTCLCCCCIGIFAVLWAFCRKREVKHRQEEAALAQSIPPTGGS